MKPRIYYECEGIQLWLGDCRDVLTNIEAGSVDLVCTDPPYGIDLQNNDRDGHRRESSYAIIGDADDAAGLFVLAWAKDIPLSFFASPWKAWPGYWRNLIVWDKGGAVGGGGDINTTLKRSWELIQVRNNTRMNGRRIEAVWRFPIVPADTELHIAAKPVALMTALVSRFSDSGQTILDPFAGSGTTLIAAMRSGRRAIGIEIDEKYCAIAKRRIEDELHAQTLYRIADADPTEE